MTLFADLANPTSNGVYQRIGFEAVWMLTPAVLLIGLVGWSARVLGGLRVVLKELDLAVVHDWTDRQVFEYLREMGDLAEMEESEVAAGTAGPAAPFGRTAMRPAPSILTTSTVTAEPSVNVTVRRCAAIRRTRRRW